MRADDNCSAARAASHKTGDDGLSLPPPSKKKTLKIPVCDFRRHVQQSGNGAAVVRRQIQQVRGQHSGAHQQDTSEKLRPGQRAPPDAHGIRHRQQEKGHHPKAQKQEQSRVQRKVTAVIH